MGWIVLFVIIGLLAIFADSVPGKITLSASVLTVGLLLLRWITGIVFFVTLAKVCVTVMVVAIVGAILCAIIK